MEVKKVMENQFQRPRENEISRYCPKANFTPKLVPKGKCMVHDCNLRFYIEHRMRLLDDHRVFPFYPSRWLALYIEKNPTLVGSS